jgi:hypothetical protein
MTKAALTLETAAAILGAAPLREASKKALGV